MKPKLKSSLMKTQPKLYCGPGEGCKAACRQAIDAILNGHQSGTTIDTHADSEESTIHPRQESSLVQPMNLDP